jgi:phage-related protein
MAQESMVDMISLVFFRTESGNEPVREWLKGLPEEDRRVIGQDLQRLQHRWPVGMPFARALTKGLWEVRSSLPGNRIARVIFCFHEKELVALGGFIKKSQKTPKAELALAFDRMKELD